MIQGDGVEIGRFCAVQEVEPGFFAVVLFPVSADLGIEVVEHRQPDVYFGPSVCGMVVNLGLGSSETMSLRLGATFFNSWEYQATAS